MLSSLTIKNYALIDTLEVDFNNGLTIITGETGAGKSILLGGLSLILGKRADLSSLNEDSDKCVVEANFAVKNYNLASFFSEEGLDYDDHTIIRREILRSGKSRAFVNDTPVNLNSLQKLGERLIDIHSQHQTLQIIDNDYQFQVVDALAGNGDYLLRFKNELKEFKRLHKELEKLRSLKVEAIKEYDYNAFLLKELVEANLVEGDLEVLEEEYETLNNVEDIKEKLAESYKVLSDEEIGIIKLLTDIKNTFNKLANLSSKYHDLSERINSALIELDDVYGEVDVLQENLEADPERLEQVNTKLTILHNLMSKHIVGSITELIEVRDTLKQKVSITENLDDSISNKEKEIDSKKKVLNDISNIIHTNREGAIPNLKNKLENILLGLGMPNAQFKIRLNQTDQFFANGKDELAFLFSANKGGAFLELKKAASGGELSRIMLAIKSILAKYIQLPTIMFDEIDTGISGEISNQMGDIMLEMSKTMQVFAITHLPQIAAKGHTHFKVYKEDVDNITYTNMLKLNHDERIVEIAHMLGGVKMSSSAIAHAKQLLN